MNLLLVRHGEILSNVKKIYAGKSPEMLTEKGIAQAREVSDRLKAEFDVQAIYSSPVRRTIQTATIIGEALGQDYIVENSLREIEMGPWEGLSEEEVARRYHNEWKIWNTKPADLQIPGRETLDELLNRILNGIQTINRKAPGKMVLIVTHVAVIRVLLLWRQKKSLNLYKKINVPNAEVFEMNVDTEDIE